MTLSTVTSSVSYYGKLPSEGDFLRGNDGNRPLVSILDQWATDGLKLLTQDVAWKLYYDKTGGLDFAFMGSRHRSVIGGHLLPSVDASGRRFPFVAAVTFESPQPLAFIPESPLAFGALWSRLGRDLAVAKSSNAPGNILADLSAYQFSVTFGQDPLLGPLDSFLNTQTVGSLQLMLNASGHEVDVRRLLIGLGILLMPVRASRAPKMGKGLRLPLPIDPQQRYLVCAFWLDLITGFLGHADFELMVLQRVAPLPMMTLGFCGISGRSLYGAFDPGIEAADTVLLDDPEWVEGQIQQSSQLKKISNYTSQNDLSLATARTAFRETFWGA